MHQCAFLQLEVNIAPWHVSLKSTYLSILSSHLWTTCFHFLKANHIAFEIPWIFGEWNKNPYKPQGWLPSEPPNYFDKTKTTKLVQWANHKWNHIFFHLCNHTMLNFCNVKHIATITITHWYELHSQFFNIQTFKCGHHIDHQMKNIFGNPLHTSIFHTY